MGEDSPMDVDLPSSASEGDEVEELPPSSSSSVSKDKWKTGESSTHPLHFDDEMSSSDDDDQDGGLGGLTPQALSEFCKSASKCFFQEHGLVSHQINSYNHFIDVGLQKVFDSIGDIEITPDYDPSKKGDGGWRYATVRFGKVVVERPAFWVGKKDVVEDVCGGKSSGKVPARIDGDRGYLEEGFLRLLPKHARLMRMSYSGRLKVEISWEVYTQESSGSDKFKTGKEKFLCKNVLSRGNKEIFVGRIPVMLKSKLCWLSEEEREECQFDRGGYFIIKGAEKTFIAQEERCMKRLWIDGAKGRMVTCPSEIKKKRTYIKLESPKSDGANEGKTITIWFLYTTLPIWLMFFALGASSDKEICEMIDVDLNDPEIANILLSSIREADDQCKNFRQGKIALKYIDQQIKDTKLPPQESVEECMEKFLFPALVGPKQKALFLAYMVKSLLLSFTGKQKCDDRDDYKFKRLDLASELLSRQLRGHILHAKKRMVTAMQKDVSAGLKPIERYVDASIITNGLSRAFSTGAWNHSYRRMEKSVGVVATLRRTNPLQMVADMRKTRQQVAYTGMTGDARFPNLSYWGKICFVSTPDGENCGLVKNLAVTGLVSTNSVEPCAELLIHCGMEQLAMEPVYMLKGNAKVFLNGTWIGICPDSGAFVKNLRNMRRRKLMHPQVEIKLDQQQGEVRIFSDAGRILRPLLIFKNLKKIRKLTDEEFSIGSLVDEKIIEFIGAEEEEDCIILPGLKKFMEHDKWQASAQFTHCELDSSYLLGLSCGIIPFANHNLAKRVLYQSEKHSQQAIGFSTTNPSTRIDTASHQLYYPQIPLFRTMISECLGKPKCSKGSFDDKIPRPEFFNGQNAVVAVNVYLGYNQEDSIVMNKASIERGMFRSEHIRSFKAEVDNKEAFDSRRYKVKDPVNFCKIESKFGRVDSLDDDGFPYVGANLESGDIIIGKAAESGTDFSIKLKHTERGKVQKVVLSANDEGKNFAAVSLRQVRMPCLGDKFSSMHGQKGVIGFLEKQENFPFTNQGIVPDIVINPHAFPTRQTPGQLLEAALGKGIAMGGSTRCATPFSTPSVERISEQLHRAGFQRWGAEKFYDGRNGESIDRVIFIGPTFYQRLIHMAEDKLKFRNTGPVHPLTRQPVADRKRFGGLKFGEMERDCLLAHGASANLHERLFTLSDYSHMYICRSCERIANVILRPLSDGSKVRGPYCRFCSSGEKIIKVNVPYGAKLLTQELFSMGICLKFGTEES